MSDGPESPLWRPPDPTDAPQRRIEVSRFEETGPNIRVEVELGPNLLGWLWFVTFVIVGLGALGIILGWWP